MDKDGISFFTPVFNEAENLESFVYTMEYVLAEVSKRKEIILVDKYSITIFISVRSNFCLISDLEINSYIVFEKN